MILAISYLVLREKMTCTVSRLKIKQGSRKNSFMCFPDALATVFSRVTVWMRGSDKVVRQIARFYFVNAKYMALIAFS